MKTALRREMEAAGWRALGFMLVLGALGLGTYLWGQHIEGRIDSVVTDRQHDHRVLRQLVHDTEPVAGAGHRSQAAVQHEAITPTTNGGTSAPPEPAPGGNKQPPSSPNPHEPRHHSPPAPPSGGSEGTAPTSSPAPASSPPPITQPAQTPPQNPGEVPKGPPLGVPGLESVKAGVEEAASGITAEVGKVVEGVKETGCSVLGQCP